MPQTTIPLNTLAVSIAAAQGRVDEVRAEFAHAASEGFPPGTQRYAWPLLRAAATLEADARGLPAAESGRVEALERIRKATRGLVTAVPVWSAHERWVRAELLRAGGEDTAVDWAEAGTAFEPLARPYDLARVRHRWAEALLGTSGPGDKDRVQAAELLRLAHVAAVGLGARPLAEDIALLAQRARISLTDEPGTPAAGGPTPTSSPAPVLGLTRREQDVLRLVSVGRSNRQIAGELYISPKTASVHVSNILAKLGVSGRGEAAAMAHRLRLFQDPSPAPDTTSEPTV